MTDENTEALEIYRIDPKKRNLKWRSVSGQEKNKISITCKVARVCDTVIKKNFYHKGIEQ
jgi:hypothetical protein